MSTRYFEVPGSAPRAHCARPEPSPAPALRRSRSRRLALTAAGATVVLVGSAGVSAAQAVQPSTAALAGGTLQFTAGPGHANQVNVSRVGAEIRVHDALRPILPVAPCLSLTPHMVRCPAGQVQSISVRLGDGNDVGRNSTTIRSALSGGAGNDTLSGALARDVFIGGPGTDLVTYADRGQALTVTINNVQNDGRAVPAEHDDVRTDVENVTGGSASDVLVGSAVRNVLRGLAGNDHLLGLAGPDLLVGDAGNDTLVGAAGNDQANGGVGADNCSAEVTVGCP